MWRTNLIIVAVFLACAGITQASAADKKLVHTIQFSNYEKGPIHDWLHRKGFEFKQDAARRDRIDFDIASPGVIIKKKKRAFGKARQAKADTRYQLSGGFVSGSSYAVPARLQIARTRSS